MTKKIKIKTTSSQSSNKNIRYMALFNVCFLYHKSIKEKREIWNMIHERNTKQANVWVQKYIPLFIKDNNHKDHGKNKYIHHTQQYKWKHKGKYYKVQFKSRIGKGGYGEIWESKSIFVDESLFVQDLIVKKIRMEYFMDALRELVIHNELYCYMHEHVYHNTKKTKYIPEMKCIFQTDKNVCIGMPRMDGTLYEYIDGILYLKTHTEVMRMLMDCLIQCCEMLIFFQERYRFMHRDFHAGNIMYRIKNVEKTNDNESKTEIRDEKHTHTNTHRYEWFMIDFGMTCIETKNTRIYPPTESKHYNMIHGFNASQDMRLLFLSLYGYFMKRLPTHFISLCRELFVYAFRYLPNSNAYNQGITDTYDEGFFYRAYGEVVHIYDPLFDPALLITILKQPTETLRRKRIREIKQTMKNSNNKMNTYGDDTSESALKESFHLFSP